MILSKFINKHFFNKPELSDSEYSFDKINVGKERDKLKIGDVVYAAINTTLKENGKKKRINQRKDLYIVKELYPKILLADYCGDEYKTSVTGIKIISVNNDTARKLAHKELTDLINSYNDKEKSLEEEKYLEDAKALGFTFSSLPPEEKLSRTIDAGIKNIWMVGPAGCGKSTMARNIANLKELPYLCISCGIGTSATEFIGYKYPTREKTRFAEFYEKPSIILIDELTALDPAVAQILNSALANDEIETTTGLVHRHPNCIIIATSNTFGFGADRQYVANNQLDASTIDRFIGGIVEVSYSKEFESKYDKEVNTYINILRRFIDDTKIRKIVSTRMIQAGHTLKYNHFIDWRERLIINWSDNEKNQFKEWLNTKKISFNTENENSYKVKSIKVKK